MARYKHYDYAQKMLLAVSFEQQILPGTFEYTLHKKPSASISNAEGEVRVHSRAPRPLRDCVPVPALPGLKDRVLRLGGA